MAEPSIPPALDDEAPLVAGLRRGEAAAFDAVYGRYRPRLYAFLRRLSGRRELADDLFQETWLQVAANAHRLAEDSRLAPWLFTIARNRYLNHRRWLILDGERLRRFGRGDDGGDQESPFELASLAQTQRRLERALARLPPADREVLLLVVVEGLPHDEVAHMLKLRPEALRQRLSRARGRLAEQLAAGRRPGDES